MSQTIEAPVSIPVPRFHKKRWTIAEFDRLVSQRFLREGGPEFLWDGEILLAMSENPPHVFAVSALGDLLKARLTAAGWTVLQNAPINLREGYKPQPDLIVLRGPRSAHRGRTPTPADVALLVEVADSTYSEDAGGYLREYAGAGITRYWVVNIPARRIEVYSDAGRAEDGTPAYLARREYGLEERVPLDGLGAGDPAPEPVAVLDVLRDSIEPPGGGA
jgi:hypothetical protein